MKPSHWVCIFAGSFTSQGAHIAARDGGAYGWLLMVMGGACAVVAGVAVALESRAAVRP